MTWRDAYQWLEMRYPSKAALAQDLDVAPKTLSDWEKREYTPREDAQARIIALQERIQSESTVGLSVSIYAIQLLQDQRQMHMDALARIDLQIGTLKTRYLSKLKT